MPIVYKAVVNDSERDIKHWRTKGSKNGVRLWQHEDGSYTNAGKTCKPGGRYNQAENHEDGSSVSSSTSKPKKNSAEAKREKNAAYNDKIGSQIPYSRDDLSDYEKQQELAVMTAQLKYANEMKEFQKKAESTNYKKVAEEFGKEMTKSQAKILLGVGVAALAVGGLYASGYTINGNALDTIIKAVDPTGAYKLADLIKKDSGAVATNLKDTASSIFKKGRTAVDAVDDEIYGQMSFDDLAKQATSTDSAAKAVRATVPEDAPKWADDISTMTDAEKRAVLDAEHRASRETAYAEVSARQQASNKANESKIMDASKAANPDLYESNSNRAKNLSQEYQDKVDSMRRRGYQEDEISSYIDLYEKGETTSVKAQTGVGQLHSDYAFTGPNNVVKPAWDQDPEYLKRVVYGKK